MTGNNAYTIKLLEWSKATEEEKRKIMQRSEADMEAVKADVSVWIDKVRQKGDEALVLYARKFDKPDFTAKELRVTACDIEEAYKAVAHETLAKMREQIRISRAFHEASRAKIEREWQIETVQGVITGAKTFILASDKQGFAKIRRQHFRSAVGRIIVMHYNFKTIFSPA